MGRNREVHVVGDGQEAWEFLQREASQAGGVRPDVILLDLNMPRMDGRELLTLLKGDERLRSIPTVVFTTSSAEEDIVASYDRHANAFVTKPADLDGFFVAIERIDAFFTQVSALPSRTS